MERGRWWRRLVAVLVLIVAVGGGWWAGRVTTTPAAQESAAAPEVVSATVTEGSVGRALTYNVTVSQPFALVATNHLSGVVTAVGGTEAVAAGDELYAVAGRPVYALRGAEPFYRDLVQGVRGEDVTQLQEALVSWGHLAAADGVFGSTTGAAVRAWQRATGQEQTGTVSLGTLVSVPELPGAVKLGESIVLGAQLGGGEDAVLARSGEPVFALVLSSDQASAIRPDATVEVSFEEQAWPAVISGTTADENGQVTLALTAPDGSLVCGEDCANLPAQETLGLLSEVAVVPSTSGPAVPVAAVRTDASAATYVLNPDGEHVPVQVIASGDGIAIVDGVAVGDEVVVVGGEDD